MRGLGWIVAIGVAGTAGAQTSPEIFFGHPIGADYVLPNYIRFSEYWRKLDAESDRIQVVNIGKTAEGRDQLMAIVSSEENLRHLDRWKEISRRLAQAELPEEEAHRLAAEGKAVVWIDGGLHANETLGAQQLLETTWQLVSRNDPETRRIREECVVLLVHANPDGMDLVSDWYMRAADPTARSIDRLPRLYQKYIGHDNNRDFYASTQAETRNMNRVMVREWFPQIVYNHHQTGPRGTVMFAPPFRPPFNHHVDPLVTAGTDLVGMAMHDRFLAEGKPGVTMRTGAGYSAWWNGGLRTHAYFHNIIGILTETIGSPTPSRIPWVAERQVSNGDLLAPIEPQAWPFRKSVDYSVTANYAILDLAARRRERFLQNVYRMGRNAIDKGRRDSWTNYPSRVAKAKGEADLRDPALRDARAYVISRDVPDFPTAVKFANALIRSGVRVHRLESEASIGGKTYPAGSLVVRTDQAYRAHVLDMFEPQDHPNDIPAPGAPPTPPYDNAGYTLAFQMGVPFHRILDGFEANLSPVEEELRPPKGRITGPERFSGYLLDPRQNDVFSVVTELNPKGYGIRRITEGPRAGWFYLDRTPSNETALNLALSKYGIDLVRSTRPLAQERPQLVLPARTALWDRYGGSMPSGWIRWLLEQMAMPFQVAYPSQIEASDFGQRFDVLILPDGAISGRGMAERPAAFPTDVPEEYRPRWGELTRERSLPALRRFLEGGGTVVAIGSSTRLATELGLPIESALIGEDGKPLTRERFFVPGSILQAKVDPSHPIAWGMPERTDFFFDESPAFRLRPEAVAAGVRPIAWFDSDTPLRSGWAWGQRYLKDGVVAAEVPVGKGRLLLFGPEITFRAQPHGTFRLLFNALIR